MGGFFKIRRGTNECQFEGPSRAHCKLTQRSNPSAATRLTPAELS